jgi:hypothetical protein
MGPFGKNTHNGGNVRNVPIYTINPCSAYIFHEDAPQITGTENYTFINILGEIRSK